MTQLRGAGRLLTANPKLKALGASISVGSECGLSKIEFCIQGSVPSEGDATASQPLKPSNLAAY